VRVTHWPYRVANGAALIPWAKTLSSTVNMMTPPNVSITGESLPSSSRLRARSASADQVAVFAANAFRCFQTRLQSASLIDPSSGANKFGSWLHSTGVAEQIVGSAVAVATAE